MAKRTPLEYHLLTPLERSKILHFLKKGPKLEDRQTLADFTAQIYKLVTNKDLKTNCDAMMKAWRKRSNGTCTTNQTFVW